MKEKVEKFTNDIKQLIPQLAELRDLYWLNIDRSNDADRERGRLFNHKFNKIQEQFLRTEKTVIKFLEQAFANPKELAREEAINKLSVEFPNFSEWDSVAKNALIEKYTQDILNANKNSRRKNTERSRQASSTKLSVTLPDGTVICEATSAKTLAKTIQKIGVEKVIELDLMVHRMPFITKNKDSIRGPLPVDDDFFVCTHSSTSAKQRMFREIAQRLNLNLKVKVVER